MTAVVEIVGIPVFSFRQLPIRCWGLLDDDVVAAHQDGAPSPIREFGNGVLRQAQTRGEQGWQETEQTHVAQ